MCENSKKDTAQSMHVYTPELFTRKAADVVAPLLLELRPAQSVVDVGCGVGTWLSSFADNGVSDYRGLDGDHVPRERLMIPEDRFTVCNLEAPIELGRRFDLCLCLEVAEHLHESAADRFISFLASLSNCIAFSAAIPGQTGQNHFNLQWPSYWAQKFEALGYHCYDPIRPRVWADERVDWWYQQNMLLFVHRSEPFPLESCVPLCRVHPTQYLKVLERFEEVVRSRRRTFWQRIKGRLS